MAETARWPGAVGDIDSGPSGAWYAFESVWIGNENGSLARFDPDAGAVVATIDVGGPPTWLEGGDEAVWLANGSGGEAVRIDPASNAVVARVRLGESAAGIDTNAEGVWIRDVTGSVHRIDQATHSLAEVDISAAVGAETSLPSLNYGGESLWVRVGGCDGTKCDRQGVVWIDPETNEVVASEDLRSDRRPHEEVGGRGAGPDPVRSRSLGHTRRRAVRVRRLGARHRPLSARARWRVGTHGTSGVRRAGLPRGAPRPGRLEDRAAR